MPFVTRSWWRSDCIIKIRERLSPDGSSHDAFERPNHILIFGRDQCECVACALSAPRATDAVDVGIGSVWHIEVDHV